MKNRNPWNAQLVVGLIIIAVGVLFVLDNMNMIYAWDYVRYWPAVLLIVGVVKLADPNANKFWAWVFVSVGGLMLLDRMDYIVFNIENWWPVILIALGGTILWGSLKRRSAHTVVLHGDNADTDESFLSLTAVMGGFEKKVLSEDFRGGNLTTIMGGAELDFRQAVIKGDEAVIDVFVLMGGIEMKVPENWQVKVTGIPIMGGFSDETRSPSTGKAKRLIIQGNVVMGGIEIKN